MRLPTRVGYPVAVLAALLGGGCGATFNRSDTSSSASVDASVPRVVVDVSSQQDAAVPAEGGLPILHGGVTDTPWIVPDCSLSAGELFGVLRANDWRESAGPREYVVDKHLSEGLDLRLGWYGPDDLGPEDNSRSVCVATKLSSSSRRAHVVALRVVEKECCPGR